MLLLQRPVVQHTETRAAWWPLPCLWKKTSVCLQCSDLPWGALETAFPDLGLAYSISLEATDNKTELDRQTSKEHEIMNSGKKLPANPSDWKFTHTSPKKTYPQKMFKRPLEYLTRVIGEVLSLYEVNP